MDEKSVLTEFLGEHPIMLVVDFLLENKLYDYSKKQIIEGTGIGKVTLFKYWPAIEEMGLVKVSRKFGKAKLYMINESNPIVKDLVKLEFDLSRKAAEKYVEKIAIPA